MKLIWDLHIQMIQNIETISHLFNLTAYTVYKSDLLSDYNQYTLIIASNSIHLTYSVCSSGRK
jgi:hypothetical protein